MYISCSSLWDAGITKDKVSCCGNCHDDADMFPGQYDLIEIYEDDIGIPRKFFESKVIGTICCAVSNFLNNLENKRELLLGLWEANYDDV